MTLIMFLTTQIVDLMFVIRIIEIVNLLVDWHFVVGTIDKIANIIEHI